MGGCSSCCRGGSSKSTLQGETEMTGKRNGGDGASSTTLAISRKMSAPTITITEDVKISGSGLALANVVVEQDSAYWEWHITSSKKPGSPDDTNDKDETKQKEGIKMGVATRKDQKFYRALQQQANGESKDDSNTVDGDGTTHMRVIPNLCDGDTIGVAVQQSGFPMIEFWHNGKELPDAAIDRFRGSVYPAVFLPENNSTSVTLVYREDDFRQTAPHGPLMVARGLI